MIRPAKPSDTQAIVDLGLDALSKAGYENLVIDKDKVREVAIECISSSSNFAWVAEEDGKVVAAVSAVVHDMMFYERKQATVVQFYTLKPNAGLPLMREFLKWARGRRAIKVICFTLECRTDPRIGVLLERLGLQSEIPMFMEFR